MEIKLDPWQQRFIDTVGDKILCCGRQVGKSVICAMDAAQYAVSNPKKTILMIAPTERQAYELFSKTLDYLLVHHKNSIKKGKDRPTKSKINLKNGTKIYCLPTGISGLGIRGLTVHRLYVDEASRIPDEVWTAVTPMMLTTAGSTILLSTPAGREGYFYKCWINEDEAFNSYVRFSTDSEKVIKERELCVTWTEYQRDAALTLLARERARMGELQYAQEYMGQFVDELRQFFPTELIRSCMTLGGGSSSDNTSLTPYRSSSPAHFLGVDVARMGGDETVLFSLLQDGDELKEVDLEIHRYTLLTETVRSILTADRKWNYKNIYIDDGGMGVGVFDPLLEHSQTKRKVIAINNASRSIDNDTRKKRLLKEDLYANLLHLMEKGKIKLKQNPDVLHSLKSIQAEYSGGKLKIFGRYSHITEALIRASWCLKSKSLNIYIN